MTLIFGIESTCDETSCSVVRDGKEILSNVIFSQADIHSLYGGVVPEIACRRHLDVICNIASQALDEAGCSWQDIDAIAVAKGPGLVGALLVGLNYAKGIALALQKPLIGINHVEAHLYAAMMSAEVKVPLPALGLIISGGHTSLLQIDSLGSYTSIGRTVDDAVGEAFDKVGCLLGLSYPGGPKVEQLAKKGNPNSYNFKAGQVKKHPLSFSFSGLKTSVLYTIKGQNSSKNDPLEISEQDKANLAASFQKAALKDLVSKTKKACDLHDFSSLCIGGGVSQNRALRQLFDEAKMDVPIFWPTPMLCLDNAAMIAGLGYHYLNKTPEGDSLELQASPRLAL
jgi:N6-L-threonylcarbamoyladenine synthase